MDYVSKFQAGGQASEQDQQLNTLAQAFLQLQQLGQAAEEGDEQAKAVMQEIQTRAQMIAKQAGAQMAKCGAKLKKKEEGGLVDAAKCGKRLKKVACGKKLELGSKLAKGGCPCKAHLKRVGGKLVTVDCNDNIIK